MQIKGIAMRAVRGLVLAAVLTLAFKAEAQTAASDSLTRALATFWGTSVKSERLSPAENLRFLEGVEAALTDTTSASSAYRNGIGVGMNFLSGLREMESLGMKVDREAFAKAVVTVLNGGSVGFTAGSAGEFIDRQIAPLVGGYDSSAFTPESQAAFLAEAAGKKGAVTTPSGLVFEVITEGEGDFPGAADKVNIEYTGRLSNGSVFDKTEEPVSFDLVRLVPGFREGLQMMRPGGEYRIVLPASLGYGERGVGDVIPPGAAIEFTVRLLSVDRSQL
ncbi:FKBP-type peptidyl-prolyl cis-trans isomerase [Duncaniella muris]|uniref:FKBP-type peptidyl-prolyl cis-trans isomerase n=1 Tax=Duncaniella muris TaxID=2094150 RepID=UPI002714E82E|nr:FKBP-type peptidyl-prolyl cis-trans isomerase [Duncaniella muris]